MSAMRTYLVAATLAATASAAVAQFAPAPALELEEKDDGQSFRLSVGDEVLARFGQNPSDPYRWEMRNDPHLQLIAPVRTYYYSTPGSYGGQNIREFRFRVVQPGRFPVIFAKRSQNLGNNQVPTQRLLMTLDASAGEGYNPTYPQPNNGYPNRPNYPNQPYYPGQYQPYNPNQPYYPGQGQQYYPNQPYYPDQGQRYYPNRPYYPGQNQQQYRPAPRPNDQGYYPDRNGNYPDQAEGPDTIEPLGRGDAGQSRDIPVAQEQTIALDANATTGYRWQVVSAVNVSLTEPIAYQAAAAPRGMVGRGGTALITFQVVRPGRAQLVLRYAGPGGGGQTLTYYFRGI